MLIAQLWVSIIVGKHSHHELSVKNETFKQIGMRNVRKALIGLPELTGWCQNSMMQLHLQTENLFGLPSWFGPSALEDEPRPPWM